MSFLPLDYQIPVSTPSYEYKPKVLELIAQALGDEFSGPKMVSLLKSVGVPESAIEYPNTKWKTILGAFNYANNEWNKAGVTIENIIEEYLDPLNHSADEEKTNALVEKIKKLFKYTDQIIVQIGNKYHIFNQEDYENYEENKNQDLSDEYNSRLEEENKMREIRAKYRAKDLEILIANKKKLFEIRDFHQAYMDLLEAFCNDSSHPTDDLNLDYLFLKKHLKKLISDLRLNTSVVIYTPFKNDLYSAEKEWEQNATKGHINWDKIRPNLFSVHSWITQRYNAVKNHGQQNDDEKKLETINKTIEKYRAQKSQAKQEPKILEILHKYEKPTKQEMKTNMKTASIAFKDAEETILINDIPCKLPPYGNEHYLARAMFRRQKNEAVDWSIIYNEMEVKTDREIPPKEKWHVVYDAMEAMNKRIQNTVGTKDNLFRWKDKSIQRNY